MIRNAARVESLRKNHANTFVPQVHQGYPSLRNCVDTQRSEYVHYQKKKAIKEKWRGNNVLDDKAKEEMERLTRMLEGTTEKRIQLLEAEDFVWDALAYVWEL